MLLVEDAQWADDHTLAVLAALARWARVVVTLRTPSPVADRLPATTWLDLPELPPDAARALVPGGPDDVLARAGGNPLALVTLARHPELAGSPLAHTAETCVKAGMGKLGARTRTEAAVLAAALPVAAGA